MYDQPVYREDVVVVDVFDIFRGFEIEFKNRLRPYYEQGYCLSHSVSVELLIRDIFDDIIREMSVCSENMDMSNLPGDLFDPVNKSHLINLASSATIDAFELERYFSTNPNCNIDDHTVNHLMESACVSTIIDLTERLLDRVHNLICATIMNIPNINRVIDIGVYTRANTFTDLIIVARYELFPLHKFSYALE